MDRIKKDCKKRIYRSLGIIGMLALFMVIALSFTYGRQIFSLLKGGESFDEFEEIVVNKENEDVFNQVKNEYTNVKVKTIIGSYAEYGSNQSAQDENKSVYYIMPIKDGSYFISIIVNNENLSKFDEMEKMFYKNLGEDKKTYPDEFEISGGFVELSEEEKAYAMEFFEGYDENVKDVSNLSQIVSPYAIVIDEIGSTQIQTIWIGLGSCICLFGILVIIGYILHKDILLKPLVTIIDALSENDRNELEEDYNNASILHDVRFGKKYVYCKTRFAYEIIEYTSLIWMYKEQSPKQRVITYQIKVYNKEGKDSIFYKHSDEKIVEEIITSLFDHCEKIILGYQFSLYMTAINNPEKLYKKVKEIMSLEEEIIDIKKEEIIEKKKESSKIKKEAKKKKKRKVVTKKEESIPQEKKGDKK